MRLPAVTNSTEPVSSIRTWPSAWTGTHQRYGAPPSLVHGHRGIVAIETMNRAPVGIDDQALGGLVGARCEQHAHDHVVGRSCLVVSQQLLDETRQAADDFIDEAQPRGVMHLFGIGPIGGARFPRELVQEYGQQPRLVHRLQLVKVVDFGLQVHIKQWVRTRSAWWS